MPPYRCSHSCQTSGHLTTFSHVFLSGTTMAFSHFFQILSQVSPSLKICAHPSILSYSFPDFSLYLLTTISSECFPSLDGNTVLVYLLITSPLFLPSRAEYHGGHRRLVYIIQCTYSKYSASSFYKHLTVPP